MKVYRWEEFIVGTGGSQVQANRNIERQCENWQIPLAKDGTQSTGQDGTAREEDIGHEV